MFITNIVEKLWESDSEKFSMILDDCEKKGTQSVFDELIDEMNLLSTTDEWQDDSSTFILTSGCTYACNKKSINGCSFCNFLCEKFDMIAKMQYLRKNDISLYNECAKESISLLNGYRDLFIDEFAIEDVFCNFQLPDSTLEMISSNLSEKPVILNVQCKASTIEKNRYIRLESMTRKILNTSIGMETANEWLRVHWLNKIISNKQIIESGKLIDSMNKGRVSVNVLFGIPGFNPLLSINNFIETIQWLSEQTWVSGIVVSPLLLKTNTLQKFIDENFYYEKAYDGSITAVSFYYALEQLYIMNNNIMNKINISNFSLYDFLDQCKENIRDKPKYKELELKVVEHFKKYTKDKIIFSICDDFFCDISNEKLYKEYMSNLNKYNSNEKIQIKIISKWISKKLFPENNEKYFLNILDELNEFDTHE
ncbi:hypothetical protein [Breznakia pachnodae]|uniref:Fe-S cluster-containing MiaB family protein n=1 Tax=Breznakia pachnodae TaxID=265178 RepID=A0ABU0E3X2_9FIRM|nr:hypothetical protein [Breznakia pachnodae]MDQ0361526.1 putative Fe-S cluster-containing MiaB family protein [Breznakia pachnodae]